MTMALLALPTEIITAICRHASLPTVINLRMVCRRLNNQIAPTFFMDNFATLDIIADDRDASVDALVRIANCQAAAQSVRRLRISTSFLFQSPSRTGMDDNNTFDRSTEAARRLFIRLENTLPNLTHCDTIEILDGFPVCLHHRYPHFQGRKTYIQQVYNGSSPAVWVGRERLLHQEIAILVFGILGVVGKSANSVHTMRIEPQLALQDLRVCLSNTGCKPLSCKNVRSLEMYLVNCSDEYYRVNFAQKHLHPTDGWSNRNAFENDDGVDGEHECQLPAADDTVSPWETQSSRHAMVRCFLKHFPQLQVLDLDIEQDDHQSSLLMDKMPAFLSSGTLRTLTISTSLANGATLIRAIQGLDSLKTIILETCVFKDLKAFKHVAQGFIHQAQNSLKEVRLSRPWIEDSEGGPAMLCPGEACEPYLCRRWGPGGLDQQTKHISQDVLSDMLIWLDKCHARSDALTMDQMDLALSFENLFKPRRVPKKRPRECIEANRARLE